MSTQNHGNMLIADALLRLANAVDLRSDEKHLHDDPKYELTFVVLARRAAHRDHDHDHDQLLFEFMTAKAE